MSAPIADVRFLRGVFASLVFATAMCVAGVVYALLGTLSSSRDDGFLLALSLLVPMCQLSQEHIPCCGAYRDAVSNHLQQPCQRYSAFGGPLSERT